jgi:alanine racemase
MSFRYANNISFISELEYELANAWLEMNLDNLVSNVLYLKSLLPQKTKTMCVVKADAYGHGAVEVAHKLEKLDIDWFGVANIAEGKILRQSGIKLPILVLGNVFKEQILVAINYDVTLTLTSIESINNINEVSKSLAKISKVYLKIDSGMSRVGIRLEKLKEALALIKEAKNLKLIGVFTHFAESENEDFTFTNKQLEVFQDCLNKIKDEGLMI